MWGLWFVPLVICLFLIGAAVGLVWYIASPKKGRPKIVLVIAVPFGCAAIPIIGLVLLASVGNLFQKDDSQLYEEAFGYRPTIDESRMLFDDFGRGVDREIFMRGEPTNAERKRLLSIPGAVVSDYSLDQFSARGAQHGFMWWISATQGDSNYCKSVRIIDAHGFNGWVEFRVAECLAAGTDPFERTNVGEVYVVASRRT